jgi:DNA-binding LytR/AlgR family response regulator
MPHPTALIAEDESVLRDELRMHLGALWPELRIVGEAGNGFEALQQFDRLSPDIVFLDIQMPGLTGLELARQVGGRCHVVFVTAYDAHAVAAFEQGAVDYVLKPYSVERLALSVHRLRERVGNAPAPIDRLLRELASAAPVRSHLRWINASQGQEVRLITVDEVLYFQSDTKYTRVVAANREGLIRKSLKELLDELDPAMFWQVHRATVVNLNAVESVGRDLNGRVVLRLKGCDDVLQVSQPYTHLFRQM